MSWKHRSWRWQASAVVATLVGALLMFGSFGSGGGPIGVGSAVVQAQAVAGQQGRGGTQSLSNQNAAQSSQYWTADRMAHAQPLDLRPFNDPMTNDADVSGTPVSSEGWSPSGTVPTQRAQLYDPNSVEILPELPLLQPFMFGTQGARFSSTRLNPDTANTAYPHRVIGKLFFTKPGVGNFVCSASIIQRRIIVTAGHCVHSGNNSISGWYTNWSFVPALRLGVGPWGSWSWASVTVTGTWFSGGGGVPNAADYAMIELNDHAGPTRIGALLGWLGWITLSLSNNHANMMGYPCNLDACNQMHQVTAQAFSNAANNTVIYGSNMRGGSSGGPWVQNFGTLSTCTEGCGGSLAGDNQVIGVTSYGPVSTAPLYQGASVPDSRWVNVFNNVCAHRAGNCS